MANTKYDPKDILKHLSPWAKDEETADAVWQCLGEFGQMFAEQCYEQEVIKEKGKKNG